MELEFPRVRRVEIVVDGVLQEVWTGEAGVDVEGDRLVLHVTRRAAGLVGDLHDRQIFELESEIAADTSPARGTRAESLSAALTPRPVPDPG